MADEQNGESGENTTQTYEVAVARGAIKSLRKIDAKARQRLQAAIDALAADPRPAGTKALTGPYSGSFRLRVSAPGGEYRIVWTIDDTKRRVHVTDAGTREDTY